MIKDKDDSRLRKHGRFLISRNEKRNELLLISCIPCSIPTSYFPNLRYISRLLFYLFDNLLKRKRQLKLCKPQMQFQRHSL